MTYQEKFDNIVWGALMGVIAIVLVIFARPVSNCQDLINAGAPEREILGCQYQSGELPRNNWFNRCMVSATKTYDYELSLTLCVNGYYNYQRGY